MDNEFDIHFNDEQQNAIEMLQKFALTEAEQFFVLNGYAGTGKTTIIKEFTDYCTKKEIPIILLASTGRAAKVLANKTGLKTCTVHKLIYTLDVSELDYKTRSKNISFRLTENLSSRKTIYIVDESSMLSDKQLSQTLTLFGSGSLLDDFIHYSGQRKIIFVGDNAQLTPVNSNFCPALNLQYLLMKYKTKGTATNLKTTIRFNEIEVIKSNLQSLLKIIRSDHENLPLKISASGFDDVKIFPLDSLMIEDYVHEFKNSGIEGSIFITFSNNLATIISQKVRIHLFGSYPRTIMPGEIMMVQQNNYLYDIANGEHVEIIKTTGSEKIRAGLTFIPVEAEVNDVAGKRRFNCLVLKDYLDLKRSKLDNEEEFNLTKDFMIRMRKMNIDSKNTPELFKDMLLSDKYMNALRARYGYAVTCHKAQGGEWPNVYIILEKSLWHPNNKRLKHRWAYTAITRTQTRLFLLDNLAIV